MTDKTPRSSNATFHGPIPFATLGKGRWFTWQYLKASDLCSYVELHAIIKVKIRSIVSWTYGHVVHQSGQGNPWINRREQRDISILFEHGHVVRISAVINVQRLRLNFNLAHLRLVQFLVLYQISLHELFLGVRSEHFAQFVHHGIHNQQTYQELGKNKRYENVIKKKRN